LIRNKILKARQSLASGCRKRRRPQKNAKQRQKKTNCNPPKFNQLRAKAIYKKTSEKSEVFELFTISSSAVPLYADELEMTKSASFSTARRSLSIKYRQAEARQSLAFNIFDAIQQRRYIQVRPYFLLRVYFYKAL